MDEFQNNYAEGNKVDKKDYILYDSILIKIWKIKPNL